MTLSNYYFVDKTKATPLRDFNTSIFYVYLMAVYVYFVNLSFQHNDPKYLISFQSVFRSLTARIN
jgi:hypothetical protein